MDKIVEKIKNGLRGEIVIPSDKSISHRAVIFSALAKGRSVIRNFSGGQDPHSSLSVCCALGVDYKFLDGVLYVISDGKLKSPLSALDCGNSGTTMRLISGILSGQNFNSVLTVDESLSKRPMMRIIEPLEFMGAKIFSDGGHAPLQIKGAPLNGIEYNSKLASAQVKSCILLAGLFAEGRTTFTEPFVSRNHTELMLKSMGADLTVLGNSVSIQKSELAPIEIDICGDISSAAYFIAAALIVPSSRIILKNVGLNPTRAGILEVVQKMGGALRILDKKNVAGEDVGDIEVCYTENLKACEIKGDIIPRLIDELPVIAVLATQAEGETVIRDAGDLRNKESDRIAAVVAEVRKLGAEIEELEDGFIVRGRSNLKGGCEVETYHDHRLAMSLYVAGLMCEKPVKINGFEWVDISFPEFANLFCKLM